MRSAFIFSMILLFALAGSGLAEAETLISAQVDKASITTDEALTYKITIESADKRLPAPTVPKFKGFDVISQAQSSNFSLGKGAVKAVMVYTFILAPREAGKFNIESVSLKIGNKTYSTPSFEIEVTPGKPKPKTQEIPALPEDPGQVTL